MWVAIETTVFDLLGSIRFQCEEQSAPKSTRRVTKSLTLNGGVFLDDQGFVSADEDHELVLTAPTAALVASLEYLHKNYSTLLLSSRRGVFTGTMELLEPGRKVKIKFLTASKLSS